MGADEDGVIFTSGAVEARNLAEGAAARNRSRGRHVVASAVEHPATLAACRTAEREGAELDLVPVDAEGFIAAADLAAAVREDTALVALVHGQPDIGTLQDVPALVGAVRAAQPAARVAVDAGETAGLVPVGAAAFDADALVIGGTALGAPPWAGALAVRPGARLHPLVEGGPRRAASAPGRRPCPRSSPSARPPSSPRPRWRLARRAWSGWPTA